MKQNFFLDALDCLKSLGTNKNNIIKLEGEIYGIYVISR